jgi:uncharacterized protein
MPRVSLVLIFFALSVLSRAEIVPVTPTHYFSDEIGLTTPRFADLLDQLLAEFERETSNQILVVIYKALPVGTTVEEYARDTFRSWKPGQVGRNNGVVLYLFVEDRKIRIQTGLGLEKWLPDKLCKQIIDKDMAPRLRVGDFNGGIQAGLFGIMNAIRDAYRGDGQTRWETNRQHLVNQPVDEISRSLEKSPTPTTTPK